MAGARATAPDTGSGGILGVKFPARHDQQTRDLSGGGPGDPGAPEPEPLAGGPELERREVDPAAPVWSWDIGALAPGEVDLGAVRDGTG